MENLPLHVVALTAFAEWKTSTDKRLVQEEQDRRERLERSLLERFKDHLDVELPSPAFHHYNPGGYVCWATSPDLPGIEIMYNDRKGENDLYARPILPETPDTGEFEDWRSNPANAHIPGVQQIESLADLGRVLEQVAAITPIEIKPWPPEILVGDEIKPVQHDPDQRDRVACVTVCGANEQTRPFKIVTGFMDHEAHPGPVAYLVIEYTDLD